MNSKYKVMLVKLNCGRDEQAVILQRALNEIPMDMKLKQIVPHHENQFGTSALLLVLEPL